MNPERTFNPFEQLSDDFYSAVMPQGLDNPILIDRSRTTSAALELNTQQLPDELLLKLASGHKILHDIQPLAAVYSGHQFGQYVPQLGDGRALLLGAIKMEKCKATPFFELQLKGGGKTPYSRFGDGRAVLRSTIREYLCSEAMSGLGIPSTKALCLVDSDEQVERETIERGAMLIRVAKTHIRFGSFEYFHYRNKPEKVRELADFVIHHYHNDLENEADRYQVFLERTVQATAETIAHWQAVGFAHGVMNTDNMSILGDTLDYGPFGFLDQFDPDFICNHSDHSGRYAFKKQPAIGLWNCNALAHALSSLINTDGLNSALQKYQPVFSNKYLSLMRQKLGLISEHEEDLKLIDQLLSALAQHRLDYTRFFRLLSTKFQTPTQFSEQITLDTTNQEAGVLTWLESYCKRLSIEGISSEIRRARMTEINPKFILRNYMAQFAIEKAERDRDYSEVVRMRKMLEAPYDEQPENEDYFASPPEWSQHISISCSS